MESLLNDNSDFLEKKMFKMKKSFDQETTGNGAKIEHIKESLVLKTHDIDNLRAKDQQFEDVFKK